MADRRGKRKRDDAANAAGIQVVSVGDPRRVPIADLEMRFNSTPTPGLSAPIETTPQCLSATTAAASSTRSGALVAGVAPPRTYSSPPQPKACEDESFEDTDDDGESLVEAGAMTKEQEKELRAWSMRVAEGPPHMHTRRKRGTLNARGQRSRAEGLAG